MKENTLNACSRKLIKRLRSTQAKKLQCRQFCKSTISNHAIQDLSLCNLEAKMYHFGIVKSDQSYEIFCKLCIIVAKLNESIEYQNGSVSSTSILKLPFHKVVIWQHCDVSPI